MAKVVIHIGTHKTATTTIQDVFAHNAAVLKRHGVIYPQLSRVNGHHGLVGSWIPLPDIYELPKGGPSTLEWISDVYGKGEHTVFLSSEEFSRGDARRQVDFTEVRRLLSGFDQIEIVCVLRQQWQFIQSIYLQISKERTPPPPPTLVRSAVGQGMVDGLWADYNLLYDHLLKAFSPDEISFLDFESCRRHAGGVLGAMLSHLKTGLRRDDLELVHGGNSNPSPLSLPALAANIIAAPNLAPPWLLEATTGAFRVEFGENAKPCLFSKGEYSRLLAHFGPKNDRLIERLKAVQPGFELTGSGPNEAFIYRDAINSSYWMRCNRWMFAHLRQAT